MKLTITCSIGTDWCPDELSSIQYKIQSEKESLKLDFYDCSDCPEDANFMRSLSSALDIRSALRIAYEAGKNNEAFEVEELEEE